MRRVRIALIIGLLVLLTALLLPSQVVAIRFGWPLRRRLPQLWHRVASRLLGMHVRIHGEPARHDGAGVLIAANHVSWLDIVALGAAAPVSFIAKHEVAGWPGVSILARLQQTVFIERERRGQTGQQARKIRERLDDGDAIVLFPEGTTSDGNFLLPFKSALFGAAGIARDDAGEPVYVQPVAVVYTHVHGMPMGRYHRPVAAWPGDIPLGPHIFGVLDAGAIDVTIMFGDSFPASSVPDRKALSAACEEAIREMTSKALRGRTTLLTGREKR